jgi:hypothetical protein
MVLNEMLSLLSFKCIITLCPNANAGCLYEIIINVLMISDEMSKPILEVFTLS